ncbi:preprotein translocase subunit SecA [Microbacterium sp. UBA6741]|uniref:preprotein translocase subunit SecA n=1 Tax=Microbacterium sp. UBA6741 TaxID=1946952 RepID=UPI0025DCC16F|nr:preprotein translocase subunit SecA [Microbacterium sp. UBA6741]
MGLMQRVLRAGEGKKLRALESLVPDVNALEPDIQRLSDDELVARTADFRRLLDNGADLDDLLVDAFAVNREAAQRVIGQRHFDVQLMGGIALHLGWVAEMRTGEGKTLVSTLPVYLNALAGKGVHIVTANEYLAARDAEWMGRIHRFLGLDVGLVVPALSDPGHKRAQYAADVTYGTNNEFGFDYLRDNMAPTAADQVQRGHTYCIVDEVDSILIDEARTPLIISGRVADAARLYQQFAQIARTMARDVDYEVEESKRNVAILEPGIERVEAALGIENLYDQNSAALVPQLGAALRAKELYRRDRDYVVQSGEVKIVDEFTGRILEGRRWSDGLHQAVEAKEGVRIKEENQTLATVTLQNYFRLYEKLAGMTGTAATEAAEFGNTYGLDVVSIPTHRPLVRADYGDLIYKTEEAKFEAVVDDIVERSAVGQPVLVGTISVEKSERLSQALERRGVTHHVLNAKEHHHEAEIITQAGQPGTVTVATNMAGRGTDIMLGGNAEFLAVQELKGKGLDPVETPEEYEVAWDETYEAMKAVVAEEAEKVIEAGGLYVLGTERHESRRIDNQLRGRSGRQGDPGESRFYLSLTDDLMRLFQSGAAEAILARTNFPDDVPIESGLVSRAIRSAQSQVESRNAEMRKNVLKYDDVLNRQREAIYADRRHILQGDDIADRVQHFIEDAISGVVKDHTGEGHNESWDFDALWTELKTLYPVGVTIDEVVAEAADRKGGIDADGLTRELLSDAKIAYEAREESLGEAATRELERRVVLQVLDRRWRDHLYEMDYLKDGIGLRAMAQRDPLIEYQREGYAMFQSMMGQIKEESVGYLYNLEVEVRRAGDSQTAEVEAKGLATDGGEQRLEYSAANDAGEVEVRNDRGQVQQAATDRVRQAAARAQAPQTEPEEAPRGAFGQRTDAEAPAAGNREQRRAQGKKKK